MREFVPCREQPRDMRTSVAALRGKAKMLTPSSIGVPDRFHATDVPFTKTYSTPIYLAKQIEGRKPNLKSVGNAAAGLIGVRAPAEAQVVPGVGYRHPVQDHLGANDDGAEEGGDDADLPEEGSRGDEDGDLLAELAAVQGALDGDGDAGRPVLGAPRVQDVRILRCQLGRQVDPDAHAQPTVPYKNPN